MFGNLLKNLPAKYVYAGYLVRKSVAVMTTVIDNKIVYDVFLYTYLDNFLSPCIFMDDNTYKSLDGKWRVNEIQGEDLVSRHIFRGGYYDTSELEQYDKDTVIGIFGVRDMITMMKQIDAIQKQSEETHDMSIQAMLGEKQAYTGIEIMSATNRFNKALKWRKDTITIPAIKIDENDTYESVIGDEMDFFDFMSDKDSDEIVRKFKEFADNIDGVGNLKNPLASMNVNKEENKEEIVTLDSDNSEENENTQI